METILWHDYETTGANPSQDRPVQFAGLRTNLDLQPVGDPLVIYCRIPDDCVPSPYACLVTGISPQLADEKGLNEPDFIQRIQAEMIKPNTCSAGYNSIRFDDEITRYTLYRNFVDPYSREWKNGNSRWDIIDMVRLVHCLRPDTLKWPKHENGNTSFRLEQLTAHNEIGHQTAHDALSDVEATIELARLIKSRQPKLYEHYWKLRRKKFVSDQLDIPAKKPFLHVSSRFPTSRGCAAVMAPLTTLKSNPNVFVAIDLTYDPEHLAALSSEELSKRVFSRSEDLPEGIKRIPLKLVHLNRSPVVLPVNMLSPARAAEFQIDLDLCQKHWHKLLELHLQGIDFEMLFSFSDAVGSTRDPEQALYDSFVPDSDRQLADSVHQMLPEERRLASLQFQDKRLQELLFRYRARNDFDSLLPVEQEDWRYWVHAKLEQGDPYGQTLEQVFQEIDQLLVEKEAVRDQEVLKQLQIWLHGLRSKYAQA
jgi:exodeoxyribonuclease-1|tara:strand:- start:9561 stop:11000 length:1440 start_codon:yes stop_codon:yes gene_type:complete